MSLFYDFAVLQVYFIRVVMLCMEDLESECERIHYLENYVLESERERESERESEWERIHYFENFAKRSFKPESNLPPYTSVSGVAVPVHTSSSVLSHNPPPYASLLNHMGMSVYETSSLLNPASSISQYGLLSR